jgi:hypothetical protein
MSPELYILLGVIFLLLATIVYLVKTHAKERLEWTQAMMSKSPQDYMNIVHNAKEQKIEYAKPPDLVEESSMDDNEWLKRVVANAGKKQ